MTAPKTPPLIIARKANDQFVFLCPRCGRIHKHGAREGNRTAHCSSDSVTNFGKHFETYNLLESNQTDGWLSSNEAKVVHDLSIVAHRLVSNIQGYLDYAAIPPTSDLAVRIAKAEEALRVIASLEVARENPIERVTRDEDKD